MRETQVPRGESRLVCPAVRVWRSGEVRGDEHARFPVRVLQPSVWWGLTVKTWAELMDRSVVFVAH